MSEDTKRGTKRKFADFSLEEVTAARKELDAVVEEQKRIMRELAVHQEEAARAVKRCRERLNSNEAIMALAKQKDEEVVAKWLTCTCRRNPKRMRGVQVEEIQKGISDIKMWESETDFGLDGSGSKTVYVTVNLSYLWEGKTKVTASRWGNNQGEMEPADGPAVQFAKYWMHGVHSEDARDCDVCICEYQES